MDGWMDGWLDVRMTNWTLFVLWCKWNMFHYTKCMACLHFIISHELHRTNKCHSHHYKFNYRISYKLCHTKEIKM